jgi:5,5'-dehydrodivanillate O-demethylase
MEPFAQDRIPYWYGPIKDEKTGRWITTHVMNQDFVAWVGQGAIADRTQEHLGESDRGVAMMRRKLVEQMEVVARGGEPMAVIRDAELNRCITLPIIDRARFVDGFPKTKIASEIQKTPGPVLPEGFVFQAGQPADVALAYRKAMGLD